MQGVPEPRADQRPHRAVLRDPHRPGREPPVGPRGQARGQLVGLQPSGRRADLLRSDTARERVADERPPLLEQSLDHGVRDRQRRDRARPGVRLGGPRRIDALGGELHQMALVGVDQGDGRHVRVDVRRALRQAVARRVAGHRSSRDRRMDAVSVSWPFGDGNVSFCTTRRHPCSVTTYRKPLLARRQLGRRLQRLRLEAGFGLDDVTEAQIAGRTKMWRVESGRISVRQGDVLALARLYGLDATTTDSLLALAAATKAAGFQQDHDSAVAEWTGLYADLEAAAAHLRTYTCEVVHGLLQTADYARAVTAANPALAPDAVERLVAFRLQRQQSFFEQRESGRLDAVLTAGAFGLMVGSPEIMAAQWSHLRDLASREEVNVKVLPVDGVHAAMRGDFVIMDFSDTDDPPLVYLESLIGSRYVERTDQLHMYREAFDRIFSRAVPVEEYRP